MNILDILTNNQPKKQPKKQKPKGLILHETKDIVVICTFNSRNTKTGDMHQIWILARQMKPTEASKAGLDSLVCGDCKHRQSLGGACYVNLGQAPNAVYKAYKGGKYKHINKIPNWLGYFVNASVRFGAYGDPSFIPQNIVEQICDVAKHWTGYTHQWQDISFGQKYFMASVDNQSEHEKAIEMGWRSFKVVTEDYDLDNSKEIVCPNLTHGVACADCGLCDGTNKAKAKDIVVLVHGSWKKRFKVDLSTSLGTKLKDIEINFE
jgi:hypothetical protein